ncbi:hypothetical protein AB0I55_31545 [Actinocatenispora sera]|uniref:hypothetical protein n=1 Tax=Actinocatenispora sera TaxID=390989 RepID=UPI0033EA29D7
MSTRSDPPAETGETTPSEDAVARDDRVLDALLGLADDDIRYDDPALQLLAAWREDILTDESGATDAPSGRPPQLPRIRRGGPTGPAPDRSRPRRAARARRRSGRLVLATGFAVLAAGGFAGVAMAAGGAAPDSPLFPVTKVIYPARAAVAEHRSAAAADVDDARKAAKEGRDDDARRYLADADKHVRHLPDDAARTLRRKADEVRRGLSPSPDGAGGPGPTPSLMPSPEQPSPQASDTGSAEPSPSDSSAGAGNTTPGGEDSASPEASTKAESSNEGKPGHGKGPHRDDDGK